MSRLDNAKEFKEANDKLIKIINEVDDPDLLERTMLGELVDTALQCLIILAEIADMMEKRKDE